MKKIFSFTMLFGFFQLFSQDGALDISFGNNGKVVTTINNNERANALVIQPDGKIVVVGYTFSAIYGNDVICIRYNSSGMLDDTFGVNGIATFDIQTGSDDKALSIDIQSDGKFVLAGFSDNGSDKDALVMRLHNNGTLDTSFGTDGIVLTSYSTSGIPVRQDEYRVVKIHPLTGNIVVGGTSYSASNNSRAIVARYTSTGLLDGTFATGGKFTGLPNAQVSTNYLFSIEDLAIKANGKITLVGWSTAWLYLGRLNANGTMDTTFSDDGYNHLWGGRMYSVVLNSDDSFYFTGDIWTSPQTELYTGRIGANGSGITATPFNFGSTMTANSFAIAKDINGKLVVAGFLQNNNNNQVSFLVGRLLANHSADVTFGNGGFLTTSFDDTISGAFDMKIQPDGKIVLAGVSGNKVALARYTAGVLSTDSHSLSNNITRAYPIPTSDYIHIQFDDIQSHNLNYHICDISGRIIFSGSLSEYLSGRTGKIEVANLTEGLYFINFHDGNTVKFIKK